MSPNQARPSIYKVFTKIISKYTSQPDMVSWFGLLYGSENTLTDIFASVKDICDLFKATLLAYCPLI